MHGDQAVVDKLHTWGIDNKHKTKFVDTAQVVSGSVSEDNDCRPCDLKKEFNAQINISSAVIFVIGDKTAADEDLGEINCYSYLEHEFRQAVRKKRNIIIVYNSLYCQSSWLPKYMKDYECFAHPFWKKNIYGDKVGDYQYVKAALGYE